MKKTRTALAAFLLAAGLSACSTTPTPSFRSEAAPNAPLASYRTYAWATDSVSTATPNALRYQQVRDAMESSLSAAGFTKAGLDSADMIVAITLGARDKVDVTNWGPVAPYYPAYGRGYRYGWAYSYNDVDVRTVTEGSMAMDIFDAKSDRPVWHGIASAHIGSSRDVSPELIRSATDGLVANFVKDRGPPN